MNIVALRGRLASDLTTRMTSNERLMCEFRIAVQRTADESDFFTIVAWEHQAEIAQKYLRKGHRVGINGRLKTRSWTTDNGDKRSVVEVIVNRIDLIETRAEVGDDQPAAAPANDDFVPA